MERSARVFIVGICLSNAKKSTVRWKRTRISILLTNKALKSPGFPDSLSSCPTSSKRSAYAPHMSQLDLIKEKKHSTSKNFSFLSSLPPRQMRFFKAKALPHLCLIRYWKCLCVLLDFDSQHGLLKVKLYTRGKKFFYWKLSSGLIYLLYFFLRS